MPNSLIHPDDHKRQWAFEAYRNRTNPFSRSGHYGEHLAKPAKQLLFVVSDPTMDPPKSSAYSPSHNLKIKRVKAVCDDDANDTIKCYLWSADDNGKVADILDEDATPGYAQWSNSTNNRVGGWWYPQPGLSALVGKNDVLKAKIISNYDHGVTMTIEYVEY